MQRVVVAIVALVCFAAPVLWTVASYHSGGMQPAYNVSPRELPGKVLFFSASWCPACQQADPAYQELRDAGYPIRKVDVDSNPSLAEEYGIRSIPQFVYVMDGKEQRRISGSTSAARLKQIYHGGW